MPRSDLRTTIRPYRSVVVACGEIMALLKCFECGNLVSDTADRCPACGANPRVRRNRERLRSVRKFAISLSVVAAGLAGYWWYANYVRAFNINGAHVTVMDCKRDAATVSAALVSVPDVQFDSLHKRLAEIEVGPCGLQAKSAIDEYRSAVVIATGLEALDQYNRNIATPPEKDLKVIAARAAADLEVQKLNSLISWP